MKIEDMERLAKSAKLGFDDIPTSFTGDVVNTYMELDENERNCLLAEINVYDDDGTLIGLTVVKYTPMHVKVLVKSLRALGASEFKGKFYFEPQHFKIGFDRPIPTKKL